MVNEKILRRALQMYANRIVYFENKAIRCSKDGPYEQEASCFIRANAYRSAYDILEAAINGNEEALDQFDYYAD